MVRGEVEGTFVKVLTYTSTIKTEKERADRQTQLRKIVEIYPHLQQIHKYHREEPKPQVKVESPAEETPEEKKKRAEKKRKHDEYVKRKAQLDAENKKKTACEKEIEGSQQVFDKNKEHWEAQHEAREIVG